MGILKIAERSLTYWNVRTYKEIKFKERWVIRMKIKTNLLFCPSHWLDDPNANSSWSAKGLCSVYWRSAPLAWRCLCPCYKLVLTFQVLWSILVWLLALTSHLQDHFQLPEKIGKIVSFFVFFSYLTRTKQWNNIQINSNFLLSIAIWCFFFGSVQFWLHEFCHPFRHLNVFRCKIQFKVMFLSLIWIFQGLHLFSMLPRMHADRVGISPWRWSRIKTRIHVYSVRHKLTSWDLISRGLSAYLSAGRAARAESHLSLSVVVDIGCSIIAQFPN